MSTRERILDAAAELYRVGGYAGTGLKQISSASRAPIGSLYHHFPGGKDDITANALAKAGEHYQALVEAVIDAAPDVVTGVRDVFRTAAGVLVATDYEDACPIETVALEVASTNEALRIVTAEIFERWVASATRRMKAAGASPKQARSLAFAFINALEGAFVLSRAMRSPEPLLASGDAIVAAVEAALAGRRAPVRARA